MASARVTVPFLELGEEFGLTGGADERGPYELKPYLISYGDRGDFINQMQGYVSTSGGASGKWKAARPYQLPDNPRLYATTITWDPMGQLEFPTAPIQYSHAVMRVTFRQLDFNWQGSDDPGDLNSFDPGNEGLLYATQELEFGKEWLSLPNASVKFGRDGKTINSSQGMGVSIVSMQVTWHRFPIMPLPLLRYFTDSVNDQVFLGCDIGTVLFDGARTTREATSNDQVTQVVGMNFKWRRIEWNKSLRDDDLGWDFVVGNSAPIVAAGSRPSNAFVRYPYRDLSKLLLGSAQLQSALMSPPPPDE